MQSAPELCNEKHQDEKDRRVSETTNNHNGRGQNSYILRHLLETGHENVTSYDFSIISKNFNGNKQKKNLADSLHNSTTLHIHGQSVPLKLFN